MTWPADDRAAGTTRAERLFERFLVAHEDPSDPAFVQLCAEYPDEVDELTRLARDWMAVADVVDALGDDLDRPPATRACAAPAPGGDDPPAASRRSADAGDLAPLDDDASLASTLPLPPGGPDDPTGSVRALLHRVSREASGWRRYRVRREIDRGGMGRILRVWDGALRRPLAMKVMLRGTRAGDDTEAAEERQLSRFLDEAQITGQLDHPGIVPVHELGLDEHGHLYFTMRLVRGRSLRTVFELVRDGRERWTVPRALGVLLKVCEALAYAHSKQVVHRDVKPANVMVGRFGETYVMDWGLAKVMGQPDRHDLRPREPDTSDELSRSRVFTDRGALDRDTPGSPVVTIDGTAVGTPAYMSPEQAAGRSEEVGPRSDVYAVGALLYELVTGCMPYVGDGEHLSPYSVLAAVRAGPPTPIARLAPEVPPELVAICEKAMARAPAERYADLGEMAEELRAYLEGRVVRSYEVGTWAELRKWIGRNRTLTGVVVVALLSLAGALGWALVERNEAIAHTLAESAALDASEEAAAAARDAERQALLNAEVAREAQARAEQAGRREAQAADATRASSYVAYVGAVEGHLRDRELDAAQRLLAACPPELRGWEWSLLERRRDAAVTHLPDHQAEVVDVVVASGGRLIASASRDGSVRLWDTETAEPRAVIALEDGTPDALAIHPGGRLLAVAVSRWGQSSEVRLFALADGAPRGVLRLGSDALALDPASDHALGAATGPASNLDDPRRLPGRDERQRILDLVYDPAGSHLYAATDAGRIAFWSLDTGRAGAFLRLNTAPITALAFDRAGRRLLAASADRTAVAWDVSAGLPDIDLPVHESAVLAVASSPAADLVATGGSDGRVRVFDLGRPDRPLAVLSGHAGPVTSLAFSTDGGRLFSASADHALRVWDPYDGTALGELLGHGAAVTSCATADDGLLLVSGSADGRVALWDAGRVGSQLRLEGHRDGVAALAVPGGGGPIASLALDGELRLWHLGDRITLSTRLTSSRSGGALALAPEGDLLALAEPRAPDGDQVTIALWDTADDDAWQRPPRRVPAGDARLSALRFGPDGTRLASGSADGAVRVWDPVRGERSGGHDRHVGTVESLAFHPREPWLASGGADDRVVMHDLSRGEHRWVLSDLGAPVVGLAFSAEGGKLALAVGRNVTIIDSADGAKVQVLQGHQDDVLAVAWHPTQERVASASRDGSLRVWDTRSGFALITLRQDEPSRALAFDGDGQRLLAALGRDVVVWDVSDPADAWRRRLDTLRDARATLGTLLDELHDPREVTARLERDQALPPALRREALRLARAWPRDADTLVRTCTDTLLHDDDPARLADARRRARAAVALRPDHAAAASALGLALLRDGDALGATVWAERADRANQTARAYPRARDLYVLAMAHAALHLDGLAQTWFDAAEIELLAPAAATDAVSLRLRELALAGPAR